MERVRQKSFASIDPAWNFSSTETASPVNLPPAVLVASSEAYQRAFALWERLDLIVPRYQGEYSRIFPRIAGIKATFLPRVEAFTWPRVMDLKVPEEFDPMLKAYGNLIACSRRDLWVPNSVQLSMVLYGEYPPKEGQDEYGFNDLEDEYRKWEYQAGEDWFNHPPTPRLRGWRVSAHQNGNKQTPIMVDISPKGKLQGITSLRPLPKAADDLYVPDLQTRARFKANKLISFWREEANGGLFADPKGEIDTVWPHWLKGQDEWYEYEKGSRPATEDDWKRYLAIIKHREPVISGRTGRYVYQTERQALSNLEFWRNLIYYKSIQAFYFRATHTELGFKSELGYRARGRYGPYISYNPKSHQNLSEEQTIVMLSEWDPEGLII